MDVKLISIDATGLSNRSLNRLHTMGISTVGELLDIEEDTLWNTRNIGAKSVKEILDCIEKYKMLSEMPEPVKTDVTDDKVNHDNFDEWFMDDVNRDFIRTFFKGRNIDELDLLSTRAYNFLMLNGYSELEQVLFLSKDEIMGIPFMDEKSADEIIRLSENYFEKNKQLIFESFMEMSKTTQVNLSLFDVMKHPEYHDVISFVQNNDKTVDSLCLSVRALNCLHKNNYNKLSDIIFMTRADLLKLKNMGATSADDIMTKISEYLNVNESRIIRLCSGDESELIDDATIQERILNLYRDKGFGGFSLKEMEEALQLPDFVTEDRLKKNIGELLAENKLEYVDFRCYRVYKKFIDYLNENDSLSDRDKDIIKKRLEGMTLESIADGYDMTRERVRQIIVKRIDSLCNEYCSKTSELYFDEDYYRYFYENYMFEKNDAPKWLGLPEYVCNYMEMKGIKQGNKELIDALEDVKGIDAGLRLKIKNYLNRDKILIDGIWIKKNRSDIEEAIIRKFCKDDVSFETFTHIYNDYLKQEEIEYDDSIYYTEALSKTRKNRLTNARFVLWKQNEYLRYYDIDGQDYSELLDALNLDAYENTEVSTLRFIEDYPDLMKRYDIRDQYELHNLLRKILPDGSYHDFHCSRMPIIVFGSFNRDAAMVEMLLENAPITQAELVEIIHKKYGYDHGTILGSILKCVNDYYFHGEYRIDQAIMKQEDMDTLKTSLTEEFYYISEIKKKYNQLFPKGDLNEVNPYNLKLMGFIVMSGYAIKNYPSADAYFEDLLTQDDIVDIGPYRKRFNSIVMFTSKYYELKRDLRIVEFEPNKIISFRKLEQAGITREMISDYCDSVYRFVETGEYFSLSSIRANGFESELFELGFSEWFYTNLLTTDSRFSWNRIFGNIVFYKGNQLVSTKSFLVWLIKKHISIDVYDLMNELNSLFGCRADDRLETVYKTHGTDIFYDKILDRLYADEDIYYREIEGMEDI